MTMHGQNQIVNALKLLHLTAAIPKEFSEALLHGQHRASHTASSICPAAYHATPSRYIGSISGMASATAGIISRHGRTLLSVVQSRRWALPGGLTADILRRPKGAKAVAILICRALERRLIR
jgi:hypothetical protein